MPRAVRLWFVVSRSGHRVISLTFDTAWWFRRVDRNVSQTTLSSYSTPMTILPLRDAVQDSDIVAMDGRLIGNRMWPMKWMNYRRHWMTLKVTFAIWNRCNSYTSGNIVYSLLYTIYLHRNWKAHVACNFNCLFENERLDKVTASHVHCNGWAEWWIKKEEVMCKGIGESEMEELVPEWGWQREKGSWFQRHGKAYQKEQSVILKEDDVCGRAKVSTDEEWVLRGHWAEIRLWGYGGWVVVRTLCRQVRRACIRCVQWFSACGESVGWTWYGVVRPYRCAAVEKISTDMARHVITWWWSFLTSSPYSVTVTC